MPKKSVGINVKPIYRALTGFYVLRWKTPDGVWRQEQTTIPLGDTKRLRRQNLTQVQRLADAKAAELAELYGTINASLREASLAQHREAYRTHLESKAFNPKHIDGVIRRLERLADECQWHLAADMTARDLETWLVKQKQPSPTCPLGLSNRTLNSYLESLKAFTRFLCREVLEKNPFADIKPSNQDTDRRRQRRALTTDEFRRLVETAYHGPRRMHLDGPTRATLYIVACWTGLRVGELASLLVSSLRLESDPPYLIVEAAYSKRRRRDQVVLHSSVADRLRSYLTLRPLPSSAPLFPLRTAAGNPRNTSRFLKFDLKAAGIPYVDANKCYADFHAQRHTFITNLALNGVGLAQAQQLARHSDPSLTSSIYTHLGLLDQATSLHQLPSPPPFPDTKNTP